MESFSSKDQPLKWSRAFNLWILSPTMSGILRRHRESSCAGTNVIGGRRWSTPDKIRSKPSAREAPAKSQPARSRSKKSSWHSRESNYETDCARFLAPLGMALYHRIYCGAGVGRHGSLCSFFWRIYFLLSCPDARSAVRAGLRSDAWSCRVCGRAPNFSATSGPGLLGCRGVRSSSAFEPGAHRRQHPRVAVQSTDTVGLGGIGF